MLLPLVHFERVAEEIANERLAAWEHKMGRCDRPFSTQCHALFNNGWICGIVMHGPLITPSVGGEEYRDRLKRDSCVEVCRLCAAGPNLNRVVLRLWREFVFPSLAQQGIKWAISYQDADLHTGNTYRFDGWERFHYSHSGTDTRTGKSGRRKYLWIWPPINQK